jgi:hypothetical protein
MAGGFGSGGTAKLTPYQLLLAAGMLTTGCINILVKKYAYDTDSKGSVSLVMRFGASVVHKRHCCALQGCMASCMHFRSHGQ